jgi:hypothetical protein
MHRVLVATKALRSYAFSAEQVLTGGSAPQVTRLTGRAVRPRALAFTLKVGGRTEQVVRLGSMTYRRVPPARYRRLVKAAPVVDPLASLAAILSRLSGVRSSPAKQGTSFTGTLSGADAAAAGLVGNATAAGGLVVPVQLLVDRHAHVTRLALTVPLQAGTRRLSLRQTTTYGGFNAQPPISRPH